MGRLIHIECVESLGLDSKDPLWIKIERLMQESIQRKRTFFECLDGDSVEEMEIKAEENAPAWANAVYYTPGYIDHPEYKKLSEEIALIDVEYLEFPESKIMEFNDTIKPELEAL